MGEIRLDVPVLSRFECEYDVLQEDANAAARRLKGLDLVYVDPPYNQHPYGSNYFMLDLLVRYERPERVSRVSGIPPDWQRSGYNVRARSLPLLRDLLETVDAPFLLVSFNDEGFISTDEMRAMLDGMGSVDVHGDQVQRVQGQPEFRQAADTRDRAAVPGRAGVTGASRCAGVPFRRPRTGRVGFKSAPTDHGSTAGPRRSCLAWSSEGGHHVGGEP